MGLKFLRRLQAVDIEGEAVDTGQWRPGDLATGGQNQPVEIQFGLRAPCVTVDHSPACGIDTRSAALDELHTDRIEQRAERCNGGAQVAFIEARAYAQFRLWSEEGNGDVQALVLVQQANGAQRTPHTTEAGTDDQDLLFHIVNSHSR